MRTRSYGARAVRPKESFLETVTKLIPSEVLIGYTAAVALLCGVVAGPTRLLASWIVFAIGLVVTPLYVASTWDPSAGVRRMEQPFMVPQLVVSAVAFALWAFGLGVPFDQFAWYADWMGGLSLIVGALVLTVVNRLVARRWTD